MRRAHIVLAGTIVGTAGVLAFPLSRSHLSIPRVSSSTSSTENPSGTSAAGSTQPSATQPSSSSPGSSTTTTPSPDRSAVGATESYPYGQLSVKVTVDGSRITHVSLESLQDNDGRSAAIDSYAVPQLERQVIAADSVSIQGVSGATFTSQAFVDSVASALGKLGFK